MWQRSRDAALAVYRLTADFPDEERFGLAGQLRRAAVSVGANIVEGSKRASRADFARLLNIAEGSAAEVAYLLDLSIALDYAPNENTLCLAAEYEQLQCMLHALRTRILRA